MNERALKPIDGEFQGGGRHDRHDRHQPGTQRAALAQDLGWPHYGNDAGGTRYSASRQMDRTNVAR